MVFKRLDSILADLIEDAEIDAGGSEMRAGPKEGGDRLPATGGGTDSRSPTRGEGTRVRETEKPRTRSADHWTVKKPPKRAGAVEAPASALEGMQIKQAGSLFILPVAGRSITVARNTRRPTSAAVIDLAVWKRTHASAPSGART